MDKQRRQAAKLARRKRRLAKRAKHFVKVADLKLAQQTLALRGSVAKFDRGAFGANNPGQQDQAPPVLEKKVFDRQLWQPDHGK